MIRPVDANEIDFGPVSLQQVLFPIQPLRVAIGYGEALQIQAPFSGRALFGDLDGTLQSRITWPSKAALLDTRLNVNFKNIQAAAVELGLSGVPSAMLEDQLDGSVQFKTDGLRLDSNIIDDARAGRFADSLLERLGFSLAVKRSPGAAAPFGMMQATADTHLAPINAVLDRVLQDVRLELPPRALAYKDFDLKLDVERGEVRNPQDILRVGGLQIFSSDLADITGQLRFHLGSPGERVQLRDVIGMLRQFVQ